YAGYLRQLLAGSLPRAAPRPTRPPEEEARDEVEHFRASLSAVWKRVRAASRADLEPRLAEIARQASGFTQRIKPDPQAVLRDARRLGTEVEKIAERIDGKPQAGPADGAGLLEGSS